MTILHTGLKTRTSLQWVSALTFGCDGFRTGTFVTWPCQNVRLLINALLKWQNVLYFFFFVCTKTLTSTFPSTGTWVTFGGQISDEVRNCVRLIIQPSEVISGRQFTLFSERLWQFTAPIRRPPHGSNLVQLHIKWCEYNTVMRTASISWYRSQLVSPCWLYWGQVVRSYCTLSQVIKQKASSWALIWPWRGGGTLNQEQFITAWWPLGLSVTHRHIQSCQNKTGGEYGIKRESHHDSIGIPL